MVSDAFLVGFFFGFVPAMGFLYILLRPYEGFFDEKRAFKLLFFGIFGGLVTVLAFQFLAPRGDEPRGYVAVFSLLFGTAETLLFAVLLNSRRFRGRRDTPYYGLAFGLGIGALQVVYLMGFAAAQPAAPADGDLLDRIVLRALPLAFIGLYFLATILVHACVAAWVGRGAATGRIFPEIVRGAALEGASIGLFFLLFQQPYDRFVPPLALVGALVLVHFVKNRVLDPIVPPEVQREIEIHNRRVARRVSREATEPTGTDPDAARTPGPNAEDAPGSSPKDP